MSLAAKREKTATKVVRDAATLPTGEFRDVGRDGMSVTLFVTSQPRLKQFRLDFEREKIC